MTSQQIHAPNRTLGTNYGWLRVAFYGLIKHESVSLRPCDARVPWVPRCMVLNGDNFRMGLLVPPIEVRRVRLGSASAGQQAPYVTG